MLIDEVDITIKAGDGGDGLVHFYTDRWRPKGGPDGGNGGDGGSVFFEAVSDISKLHQFRHEKKFSAERGASGGPNQKTGKNGEDLTILVPVGSVISFDNGSQIELDQVGQRELAAKGGRGGKGNYHFRSSTNQAPTERQLGFRCLQKSIHIKLKLIADIGLIGLPNVGKTSLLNELTNAGAKVANYPFTTLEPNLGVTVGNKIIADIPGLIEGASDGKGLGYKFLKHIERTRILVHCLSADSPDAQNDYQTVRREIANYSSALAQKPEIIILTKADTLNETVLKKTQKLVGAILAVSIADPKSIKKFSDLISKTLN